jgi:hypothetical protein
LDIYREEALMARKERAHGDMLRVRPYLFKGAPVLIAVIVALLLALLTLGHHAGTVRIPVVSATEQQLPSRALLLELNQDNTQRYAGRRAFLRSGQGSRNISVPGVLARTGADAPASSDAGSACAKQGSTTRCLVFTPDDATVGHTSPMAALSGAALFLQVELEQQRLGAWLLGLSLERAGGLH